jgi:3-hydroxybutyryl-CoA dehydrogenase
MSGEPPSLVGIFGTGVMAHGIARLCLARGMGVVVRSGSDRRAIDLTAQLERENPRYFVSASVEDLPRCELFLEATVEEAETKCRVLAETEPSLPEDALIATTTSSLSITALASALRAPERFLGLHFFNPVSKMKLVELVAGVRTSRETVERGRRFVERLGKHPLGSPDRAGFLVNRLLFPYLNAAARLAESGFATAAEVDLAMSLGAGHPMGPFALIDLIGADVTATIGDSLHKEFGRSGDSPPPELRRRVTAGRLGRKTRQGYHPYPKKKRA